MHATAIEMLQILEQNNHKAYIVGGYPRDLSLNRKSVDIDICTDATPKELKDIFKNSMLPKVQYGSVTVLYKKIRFEITTFRKDIKYQNNRVPVKIKYIENLLDDLKRRDFTMNTLCMDKEGNIIDLLNGQEDIKKRIIKTVGNPKYRLKEDSLRILRAIRFATILDFELDLELKKYIKKYSYLLKKLSYYRKKEELDKIFSSPNAKKGIDLILELNLEKDLELKNLNQLILCDSIIGIWAQLDVLDIYTFTNNEKDFIIKINELKEKDILENENLYHYGLYISSIVGELKGIDKTLINQKYNDLKIHSFREIELKATDICYILNKKPGPFLKPILDDIEYKIITNQLENEKEILKNYLLEQKSQS